MKKSEGELEVVYANEPAPDMYGKSVFLVGPTPRDPDTPSWRQACRFIPPKVWKRKAFQIWLKSHWGEGNNVMEAEALWDGGDVTALRLKMWICQLPTM